MQNIVYPCCWHAVYTCLKLLWELAGMHTPTHTHTRLAHPVSSYQLMMPSRGGLCLPPENLKLNSQMHSEELRFPWQYVIGPSRCENHMAVGGQSWWESLMCFSWHELKWYKLKNSICFFYMSRPYAGNEDEEKNLFHQGVWAALCLKSWTRILIQETTLSKKWSTSSFSVGHGFCMDIHKT